MHPNELLLGCFCNQNADVQLAVLNAGYLLHIWVRISLSVA